MVGVTVTKGVSPGTPKEWGRGRGRGRWRVISRGGGSRRLTLACGPPRMGVRSAAPGLGCRGSSPLPPPPSPTPSYLAQGRPREVSACPVFLSASLTERRNCALGWAPSGNESLPVSLGASRLRPALWTAGWLSGATCLSVALF